MGINRDCLGRRYAPAEPYVVTRRTIVEFADAIGDPNPIYRDATAAAAAGHKDVVAPPTFPIVLGAEGLELAIADEELGLDFSAVVHGSQRFSYTRPVTTGDVLTVVSRVAEVKTLGATEMITLDTEVTDDTGGHVVTASCMLVVRGDVGEKGR